MSLGLTLAIIFGVVFSAVLFVGFLYEKELAEFEKILFRYIRLKIKARKAGLSVEDYVKARKNRKVSAEESCSNLVKIENRVA